MLPVCSAHLPVKGRAHYFLIKRLIFKLMGFWASASPASLRGSPVPSEGGEEQITYHMTLDLQFLGKCKGGVTYNF